ncbi:ATP-dependent Lon protease [Methylococcales bacterium]|nr:ATP-dependent Lon protease [Methylococcales bacterium]
MLPFEEKTLEFFGEVVIDKSMIHEAGFGSRAIPTYVGEWILSRYLENGKLNPEGRQKISAFVSKYLPSKQQKDEIKNRLLKQETVKILDDYSVSVNLVTGTRLLRIPLLDMNDAHISDRIVDENELLLTSGVWGVGELFYIPPDGQNPKGQVWMKDFKPFQVASIDLDYFIACRQNFAFDEWLDLLVSSMGFNPVILSVEQKVTLITRIVPLVEPRLNLVELAPKGTGKSFVYDNLSRYARVIGGGTVTPAVLFYNLSTNMPGLITRYDVVVLDEIQSVSGDSTGELVAQLKGYLESGKFSRGKTVATAEAGLVMLGNIPLDENHNPLVSEAGLFSEFPNFLRETAFIDRLHGFIPGWVLPRVTKDTPSRSLGFKGDFFSEVLSKLRKEMRYQDYVKINMNVSGSDDLRDRKAITRCASGYLKLLFPDQKPSPEEFKEYCVKPAVALRQRIRNELHKMDKEYSAVEIVVM